MAKRRTHKPGTAMDSAIVRYSPWARDLMRLRAGEMGFDAFVRKHDGYITRLARKWANRCPDKMCADDAKQEILIVIWQAVPAWAPDEYGGTPIRNFVSGRVHFRMLKTTDRYKRLPVVEAKFLESTIGLEVEIPLDTQVDARRRAARVIGSMPRSDDAAFIARVLGRGESRKRAREVVFSAVTERGKKQRSGAAMKQALEVAARVGVRRRKRTSTMSTQQPGSKAGNS